MTRILSVALVALTLSMTSVAAQDAERPSPKPAAVAATTPLNLNTATVAQLEELPGVGAKMAERILEYRQKNGSFKKVEDLMNVRGIGEKNFLKLKPLITVSAPKTERSVQ